MAESFEGFEACDDSDFLTIRYRDIVAENHPIRFIDRFIETIDVWSALRKNIGLVKGKRRL